MILRNDFDNILFVMLFFILLRDNHILYVYVQMFIINIIIVVFYIAPYSTEIVLRHLIFKTQLKHILSSYRSNTFHK